MRERNKERDEEKRKRERNVLEELQRVGSKYKQERSNYA